MARKNKPKEKEMAENPKFTSEEVESADNQHEKEKENGETVEENTINESNVGVGNGPLDEVSLLKIRLETVQKEAVEFREKHVRLMAEFDNFRKRTRRETENFREYANEEMMTALLPVVDDFTRTMTAMEETDNLASLKEGISLVNGKLWNILEKKGLKTLNPLGEVFDMEYHEAIHSLPVEEEEKKGIVLDVVEKGYQLKDKVIRYAKVVVGE